ncbi:MAG: FkbM family methyltransferase [Flavobacteriales bacterium]|nr:FkbM family methyltransferase [Flavobacteriales bacterium]MCX7769174.1 FkbM family methyltransferase [Flavobacteriales bacterium]MDW8411003.1 FkbM family methyltransferase [Flavobacteriales bacterium]
MPSRLSLLKFIQIIYDTNLPGAAKLARLISRIFWGRLPDKIVTTSVEGFLFLLEPARDRYGLEREIYQMGTYEKGTLYVLRNFLRPGDIFLDVGANIGYLSCTIAGLFPEVQVWAFEPNSEVLWILKENIKINNLTNIKTFSYALGSENCTSVIYPDALEGNRGGASLVKPPDHHSRAFEIEVRRLDDVVDLQGNNAILKIDVEGFEMEVLKGGRQLLESPCAPALIVECSLERNNYQYDGRDLFEFIKTVNDYKVFMLRKGKNRISQLIPLVSPDALPHHDNIFCFRENHLHRIRPLLSKM